LELSVGKGYDTARAIRQKRDVSQRVTVVLPVLVPVTLGVSGDDCVPAGIAPMMTAVGSTTAQGWTEMFMPPPLPSAKEMVTPAKPTILYVAFCPCAEAAM
jgi:hypothetical protein